ncbi:hypothetical protein [Nocardiopsis lucentensis]|uniref:hypothetical protein n=1 Tax=Nocardiopsis lucentensis TaxID=53441 RepID=UPI00036F0272|nr:hypothetical protein [Nocardiopsis lucentensis]
MRRPAIAGPVRTLIGAFGGAPRTVPVECLAAFGAHGGAVARRFPALPLVFVLMRSARRAEGAAVPVDDDLNGVGSIDPVRVGEWSTSVHG